MTRELKRVRLRKGMDLGALAESVGRTRRPGCWSDGEAIAALVSMEDLSRVLLERPHSDGIARALGAAGAWGEWTPTS